MAYLGLVAFIYCISLSRMYFFIFYFIIFLTLVRIIVLACSLLWSKTRGKLSLNSCFEKC